MVGLVTGKALAHAAGKPLIAVNHLEGHALSPRLSDPDLEFPYLLLLVSGGHCQLLRSRASTIIAASPRRSTMPPARRSTRPPSCSAWAFPGGPAVEKRCVRQPPSRAAAASAARHGRTAFLLRRPEERGAPRARRQQIQCRGYRRVIPAGGGRLPGRSHQAPARQGKRHYRAGRRRRRRGERAVRSALQDLAARMICASSRRRSGCAPTMPR
jgi:hypothetical protein